MSKKLKPCPFCGSEDVVVNSIGADTPEITEEYYVECVNCGSQTKLVDTPELAVKWWNTRDLTPYQKYAEELYYGLVYMLDIIGDICQAVSPLFHDLQSNLKDEPKQYQTLIDKIEREEATRHEF